MDAILSKLRARFPVLPVHILKDIDKSRWTRLRIFMDFHIPEDIRWLIEAKVRMSGELPGSVASVLPGMGKSSYAKRRRAKRLHVCHKCARWTCNERCRSLGWVSSNRDDKIQFIKNGLSKESLDDILFTLDTHSCGQVQGQLLILWEQFRIEFLRLRIGLTLNDPVCQFIRKLDGKLIPDS